ncbi:MAG: 5-formyltetrahydrofolate cyclo-ligase [bacterium]|nr:5-formyltetrahydrofolate cyclo-ligase [bacterium]
MERTNKQEIRKEFMEVRTSMSMEECIEKSECICQRILQSDFYQKAKVIYAYMAFRNEVDLSLVMQNAYLDNKLVAIPRVQDDWMAFYCPKMDADGHFQTEHGYFQIEEPVPDAPAAPRPDLILVPGVVFDQSGNRIGYGKGYYDAFMESMGTRSVITAGIAYESQLTDSIPAEAHDFQLHYIMTESNMYCKSDVNSIK